MSARYARFDELLALMKSTHDKKGQDYEGNGRPYENLREGEDWAVEPWKMAMMRAGEKMRRVKSFAQSRELQNESVFDSLLDIAILSIIGYVLLEEQLKTSSANPPVPSDSLAELALRPTQPHGSKALGRNIGCNVHPPAEFHAQWCQEEALRDMHL